MVVPSRLDPNYSKFSTDIRLQNLELLGTVQRNADYRNKLLLIYELVLFRWTEFMLDKHLLRAYPFKKVLFSYSCNNYFQRLFIFSYISKTSEFSYFLKFRFFF